MNFTVLIAHDDVECCNGVANAVCDFVERDVRGLGCGVTTRTVAVSGGGHRDALVRALQDAFNVPHERLFVVSLLKGNGQEDYSRVRELCEHMSPPVAHQVVTHIGAYTDAGLVVRNLVRRVCAFVQASQ